MRSEFYIISSPIKAKILFWSQFLIAEFVFKFEDIPDTNKGKTLNRAILRDQNRIWGKLRNVIMPTEKIGLLKGLGIEGSGKNFSS